MRLAFAPGAIKSMADQYACARGTTLCASRGKSFSAMGDVLSSSWKSAGSALTTVKKAAKRLVQTFQKNPDAYFARRQEELMVSYYGNKAMAKKNFSSLT